MTMDQTQRLMEEIERAEARLKQVERGLERSHRLVTLGVLASSIAHEFNNLLTPVISYCQMALGCPGDQELARKALRRALDGSQRAARICESMLGFVRDDRAGQGSCLVDEAVQNALACLVRSPEKDNIQMEVEVPRDCRVAIDPVQLQQVLMNLVLNARQAMGRKGGRIRLSVRPQGQAVEIEVADSGPGIPTELLPVVFEPFVSLREHGSHTDTAGTGLGLAICRELVERCGGEITIPRSDSSGTIFLIRLPAETAGL
jgi:signal transduction histidine kinase